MARKAHNSPEPLKRAERWRQGVRRFQTADDLADIIEKYLEDMDTYNDALPTGNLPLRPTMSGLAAYCGVTKQTLSQQSDDYIKHVLKRFKSMCEAILEDHLVDKRFATAGIIFALKNNHEWKDTISNEVTGAGGGPILAAVKFVDADASLKAEADQWSDPDFNPDADKDPEQPTDSGDAEEA